MMHDPEIWQRLAPSCSDGAGLDRSSGRGEMRSSWDVVGVVVVVREGFHSSLLLLWFHGGREGAGVCVYLPPSVSLSPPMDASASDLVRSCLATTSPTCPAKSGGSTARLRTEAGKKAVCHIPPHGCKRYRLCLPGVLDGWSQGVGCPSSHVVWRFVSSDDDGECHDGDDDGREGRRLILCRLVPDRERTGAVLLFSVLVFVEGGGGFHLAYW